MATSTYKAQLNYYDPTYGWGNESTARQGSWTGTGGNRTGVLYFPGLSALKGKIINGVKLSVTTLSTGNNASKTAKFYASASQGGIKTSLGANHKTGSQIGSVTGVMYNNSSAFTITFLSSRIVAGEDTYCIYDTGTTNYLKWSAVTLTVDWSEPATQPTLSKSSVDMGSAVTISTAAVNSAYRHTLRYAFGKATGTIANDVTSSQSWTPPLTLASQIPEASAGSGTIYCDTYSGTTLLGTKSVSITLTVPASVKPTAGSLTAAVNSDTSGTGLFVKGMGKAKLTLSGSAGAYGSTIASYKITGGGWSSNSYTLTTGILTRAGEITFTGTVTDSRGRTASADVTIEVLNYTKPGITSCLVYRCDADGNRQDAGTYAAIDIKATYSAITGNSLDIKAAYKLAADAGYGAEISLTNNGKTVIGAGELSAASTYNIKVTVSDQYNVVTKTYTISTKRVMRSVLKGLGMAIGKVAELAGYLDIAFKTLMRESLELSNAKYIYGHSADGTKLMQLLGINPDDVVFVGYTGYMDAQGATAVYGNDLRLYSNNGIKGDVSKSLWTGSWSDGSITVSGISKYRVILFRLDGYSACIIAARYGTSINGFSAWAQGTENMGGMFLSASISGDTLTMTRAGIMTHISNGSHSAFTKKVVVEIIGII